MPKEGIKVAKAVNEDIRQTINMIGEPDVNMVDLKSIITEKIKKSAFLPVD